MSFSSIILILTATSTALMAGLFFSYSFSVVLGLGRLPDDEYIHAMQAINRAIQNPVFFLGFFGTLLLLPVSAFLNYTHPLPLRFWLLVSAIFVYYAGVFGVTILGNIPLNNSLDKFESITASKEAYHAQRTLFENSWNNLNLVRTLASLVALVLVIIACLQ